MKKKGEYEEPVERHFEPRDVEIFMG